MPSNKVQNFNAYRSEMNAKILDEITKLVTIQPLNFFQTKV